MDNRIDKFIKDQLSVWPLAAENYRSLRRVRRKELDVNGLKVTLQFNASRAVSSEASLDPASISSRPCFLCPENRPSEQFHLEFSGRKGRRYRLTLNPYPIFPSHLVISSADHVPQSIWHRFQDACDFVSSNRDFVCFYNGPHSGASAPDHMHFQACPAGLMPLQRLADSLLDRAGHMDGTPSIRYLSSVREARLYHLEGYTSGIFLLEGETSKSTAKLFYRLLDCADIRKGESEPRMNFIIWRIGGGFRAAVILRERHRSHHYFQEGREHLSISPGCADMSGVFVTPRGSDFERVDSALLEEIVKEVSLSEDDERKVISRLTRTQPSLEVGIMSADEIAFEIVADGAGLQKAAYSEGKISYNGALYDELLFEAQTEATMFSEPSFILHDVKIGIGFHWERNVTQKFAGALRIVVNEGKLLAINKVGVEDYLLSVISSEMKATASLEFLKAHAVISRSWVMAQVEARKKKSAEKAPSAIPVDLPSLVTALDTKLNGGSDSDRLTSGSEYVRWFDHDDHTVFDVCADDHCQRYQGLTMVTTDNARKAIDQTWGLVLKHEGAICDARFSKCCGGMSETFGTCWEDEPHPYLQSLPDTPGHDPDARPFCDTDDSAILSQVLNDYDLETRDFYRWRTEYSRTELSELVNSRSGIDFGSIRALVPLKRGGSGRISLLKIEGEKKTVSVGKELIVRKWLSESHLKSSAFDVSWNGDRIILEGKGWGHGVGLCQIGAAVMADRGYSFSQILEHYYPGSCLDKA